eukprot:snap_masked-scaffold71_size417697-processed-gene-0.5 protein:Tk11796 transcript:snap_masked-scaffold71_size417697-processed-gene-0.5-mRNA-1 annotation:"flj37770-like protein"
MSNKILARFGTKDQRSNIKTYALAGKSATETHKLLKEAYGEKALGRIWDSSKKSERGVKMSRIREDDIG